MTRPRLMSLDVLVCVGCGLLVLNDDGAECTTCGKAVVACQECIEAGCWLSCVVCHDRACDFGLPHNKESRRRARALGDDDDC